MRSDVCTTDSAWLLPPQFFSATSVGGHTRPSFSCPAAALLSGVHVHDLLLAGGVSSGVCSGQSNMAFLLENAYNGSAMVADAGNHPTIRLFTSKKTSS